MSRPAYDPRDREHRLASGKLPHALLARLLGELPPPPPEVRLTARVGEDACGIDVPSGTLVVAADPITLTGEELARLSVLVNANDVAVCGARPRWFLAVVLVPPGTRAGSVEDLFLALQASSAEIGAALVGGHTEVTPAVTKPVVIGQMLGLAEDGRLVTTAGFGPGDVVLQIGRAPIEGAAVLSRDAGERLSGLVPEVLERAQRALDDPGISLVDAALTAKRLGARALHDPTEGGLGAGLHEMALAAGVRIRVDPGTVLWFEPAVEICRVLGCDPWATLASGTLLAAFPADAALTALDALAAEGHEAAVIGSVEEGAGVHDGEHELPWPDQDEVARLFSS